MKELLRFLTCGSVDDGKSTLIGRLLVDSEKLYEDQLETLKRDSRRMGRGGEELDYSLLLDGLRAEREQGITIDVAYRYFSTSRRKFIIADTPGHEQYTRNMITGGSTANAAIILIDVQNGITPQTRRHTRIVDLLGIHHILLAVNKMDLVGYSQECFRKTVSDYQAFVADMNFADVVCVPLSARYGDNVVEPSANMPWYTGPTLLSYLETVPIEEDYNLVDLRFPVQYVLHTDNARCLCGKVASGIVRQGMEVVALPSGKHSHIKEIVTYDGNLSYAFPPQSVALTLADPIDVSRGEMLISTDNSPLIGRNIEATLVWMDEEKLDKNKAYFLKQTTNLSRAYFSADTKPMALNEIARVRLSAARELFFDTYTKNKATGAFILIDPITHSTCAVGMIVGAVSNSDMQPNEVYTLNLKKLGIGEDGREIVEKILRELSHQGIDVVAEE